MSPEDELVRELCGTMAMEGAKVAIRAYECVLQGISPNKVEAVMLEGKTSEVVRQVAKQIVAEVVSSVAQNAKCVDDQRGQE